MNISTLIDSNRTTETNTPIVADNASQQEFSGAEKTCGGGGCPFAGKHEDAAPKEENTIPDLLRAISNLLNKLFS